MPMEPSVDRAVSEEAVLPGVDQVHSFTFRKCKLVRGRLVVRGEPEFYNLEEACSRFAPSGTVRAKINVLKAKTGDYLGLRKDIRSNFVIRNPTSDGDIRWLLQQYPEFKLRMGEVYLVHGHVIRRELADVTASEEDET